MLRQAPCAAIILTLTACGSSGPRPESSARQPAPPAQSEPAGAQTYPLEGAPAAREVASSSTAPTAQATPGGPAIAEPPLTPEAVQQFDNAVAMLTAGNVDAAEQAFRALSTAYPSYSGPLVNLAILQAKAGKLPEAEQSLKSAIERKPDNAAAHNQLGIVYRRQGRFDAAEQAYTRAVQIDPNYANAHLNLGVLCDLYLQQPQRALEAFERYLALTSAPDERVGAWVKELKVRLESAQRATGAGS